ncbi:Crp/Fnr family transcriptional regulator [Actibacterium pelagium]|uniref:cAMP-binding domain of CRP or a regulatory subunit of cAMP-dependent protein kinases n=1 Tax=Actibacterium pelagium TaxID=2029103 RepID=A0A917ACA3_9RHOB|nr:Crp/Fnr family transcriptional regulator [Actibacterium pelagium]GGE40409.1 hypothetical protein GCM10011517_05100 [Actibacterium pelagium]
MDLPNDLQNAFLDACKIRTVEAGEEFLKQGDICDRLIMIAHGVAQLTYDHEEGLSTLIGFDGAGNILGEMEALAEEPLIATCSAFKPLVLLELSRPELIKFMQNPIFIRNYSRVQVRRFRRDNELKAADHFFSVDQKLCSHLLNLSVHTQTIEQSQAALANAIGCTRQTINKELNTLKNAGIIEIRKGGLNILQRDRLAERLP